MKSTFYPYAHISQSQLARLVFNKLMKHFFFTWILNIIHNHLHIFGLGS